MILRLKISDIIQQAVDDGHLVLDIDKNSLVDLVAYRLAPHWFEMLPDGRNPLDNYIDQHKRYQKTAREEAKEIIDAVKEQLQSELKEILK